MGKAETIIKNIQEVLASDSNDAIKISKTLILISANNNVKYDRIVQAIGTLAYSQLDFDKLYLIFAANATPDEKVASFFDYVTNGDSDKYDRIAAILAS